MNKIVDFHSHVLPVIDDGSKSVEESIAMLQMETQQGINTVVATPHFYPNHDDPEKFLKRRAEAEKKLRTALENQENFPELIMGAEVYFFPGMADSDVLERLTIEGKGCMIIEMPRAPWTKSMFRELENISVKQGIVPILAHIDRYIRPFQTHGIPEMLKDMPVMVQANANFLLNAHTRRMALRMLQKDQIQLLGSDCHNLTDRQPNMGKALALIEQRLGTEVLERIASNQKVLLQTD